MWAKITERILWQYMEYSFFLCCHWWRRDSDGRTTVDTLVMATQVVSNRKHFHREKTVCVCVCVSLQNQATKYEYTITVYLGQQKLSCSLRASSFQDVLIIRGILPWPSPVPVVRAATRSSASYEGVRTPSQPAPWTSPDTPVPTAWPHPQTHTRER